MSIQWFPGHMLTAKRDAAATMGKTDVVIEVLDARVPHSSRNPMFEALRKQNQRPALKILNRTDEADPARTKAWLAYYNAQEGVTAVALSAKNVGEVRRIPEWCRPLAPHRGTKEKQLRLMILGVPNVGKSTIMNALLKRSVAKVGDEPAITKMQMRHVLGDSVVLVDTPGMLWPKLVPESGLRLAATNSIGRNAYMEEEVALGLAAYLLADYRPLLVKRYGELAADIEPTTLLDVVAKARGLLVKGGGFDREKASLALLNDFRTGTLGRITLETPDQVAAWPSSAASPS